MADDSALRDEIVEKFAADRVGEIETMMAEPGEAKAARDAARREEEEFE